MPVKLDDLIFRGLLTIAGVSIGVNSFFIKEQVQQISTDIKSLSESYQQLRVENATRDAVQNGIRTRLEICEAKFPLIEDRVRSLEVGMAHIKRGMR
jgi:hypothetical protein